DYGFELTGFSDGDYAGCKDTFKSTSGGARFLGKKLVSWSSKKQDCTSLSTAKSEYVSLSACCAQFLWMRTQLINYGYHFDKILIYCDSKSAIATAISCNLTGYQLADIFTKALPVDKFNYLIRRLDESIDSAFARFNTIITSLKSHDEGYSSKNYVRKFLRALHPKWREKVTTIEESKDLTSLSLDELIRNLKVYEMIIKKDSEIVKEKVKRNSLALKARKESSDEECLTFESEDEECGDLNHLIGECPKPPKDKNQRAFVGGSWSDSGEEDGEKVNNETCLVAQASIEEKVSTLEKNKEVDLECVKCHMLKNKNEKLKEKVTRLNKFKKSTHCLSEMLSNQKPSGEKLGLGFNSFEASSNETKEIRFVKAQKEASSNRGLINMGSPYNIQAAPKAFMGPPLVGTPGSEKSVSF
nr:uncharacterized mitochondrial protein AtMg00810-like [Tanacetum cinerariifolium]